MKAERASLTKRERERMFDAQGGMCFCPCRQPLGKRFVAEHWTPVALGNGAKPDCLLREDCAKNKTVRDIKAIAKTKRLNGTTSSQWSRRQERGSRIQGRDFTQWRGMDGSVRSKGQ